MVLKGTVCLKAWLSSATCCPRPRVNRLFWAFCFFFLGVPNCIIFSSIESIADVTGLERSRYQINWDLYIHDQSIHGNTLFTKPLLLSRRRVGNSDAATANKLVNRAEVISAKSERADKHVLEMIDVSNI